MLCTCAKVPLDVALVIIVCNISIKHDQHNENPRSSIQYYIHGPTLITLKYNLFGKYKYESEIISTQQE